MKPDPWVEAEEAATSTRPGKCKSDGESLGRLAAGLTNDGLGLVLEYGGVLRKLLSVLGQEIVLDVDHQLRERLSQLLSLLRLGLRRQILRDECIAHSAKVIGDQ